MDDHPRREGQGWRRAGLSAFVQVLFPFPLLAGPRSQRTLLDGMRLTFSMVAVALPLLVVVVAFVLPWTSEQPMPATVPALLGAGLVSLGGAVWQRQRPLPCRAGKELARAYLQRMFLGVAFADAPALLAFVAAFLADAAWPYLLGLGVSAAGLAMVAPTDGDVARRETQLRADGCAASLREAVSAAPNT